MFALLLLFALVALLFGLFTALKWLIVVALIVFLVGLISGVVNGSWYNRRL